MANHDRDEPEWNTEAMGPTKRKKAIELYHRMRDRYGAGGLVHFGQGKWYPGEPLPRWSLNCFWRKDGEPIWRDERWLADERTEGKANPEDAHRFLAALAKELGVDEKQLFPGFEDAFYYLWRERRLPVNVDPFDAKLENALERKQLQQIFSRGWMSPSATCCLCVFPKRSRPGKPAPGSCAVSVVT